MKMFLHKVVMRVVFTIAVISAFVVLRFVIQVLLCLPLISTQENFEVGDKTSHMELFALSCKKSRQ
jgi:hypothetical protein